MGQTNSLVLTIVNRSLRAVLSATSAFLLRSIRPYRVADWPGRIAPLAEAFAEHRS